MEPSWGSPWKAPGVLLAAPLGPSRELPWAPPGQLLGSWGSPWGAPGQGLESCSGLNGSTLFEDPGAALRALGALLGKLRGALLAPLPAPPGTPPWHPSWKYSWRHLGGSCHPPWARFQGCQNRKNKRCTVKLFVAFCRLQKCSLLGSPWALLGGFWDAPGAPPGAPAGSGWSSSGALLDPSWAPAWSTPEALLGTLGALLDKALNRAPASTGARFSRVQRALWESLGVLLAGTEGLL